MALLLVGLSTFAIGLLALDARATHGARLTADEPQYLLTAISLAEDLDLDISDEIDDRRYEPFHAPVLDQQTIALNDSGQRLSPHEPLLPLLLALPMRLGGWAAAKIFLAAIAAATSATTVWLAVRRFDVDVTTAAVVTGALFVSPPLTSYATQIYPEMPAALAVLVSIAVLTGDPGPRSTITTVLAVVALPWLAVKYVPIAAVIALWSLRPFLTDDRRRAALLLGVLGVAGGAYVVVHQKIYGGWTAYAAGDHFVDGEHLVIGTDPNYVGRSRRLIGLLVDRNFGLVAWTPAYLALLPAAAWTVGRRVRGWAILVSVVATGWAVATWIALTMHGWWWPGRQVVAVLPLAVVMLAIVVDERPVLRLPVVVGSALGTFSWLWLVVEASTDRRTLVVDFFATSNPWYRLWSPLFPDHTALSTVDVILTVLWIAVAIVGTTLAWRHGAAAR